jgi:hypothetical protein
MNIFIIIYKIIVIPILLNKFKSLNRSKVFINPLKDWINIIFKIREKKRAFF